ncbi:hypothetical protein [Streptomyces huiliensis]|uniref:hypothetical protein n=1 Tax=Streptomyces huiliensis TaxID=2876027 RepID=UPI001CC0612A|nr:hypothetical protein [Streptomyces huiliensis]MBZ4323185.1 hypothetical protein [Streptomyces huiliensis]
MTHSDRALDILHRRPDLAALAAYPFAFDIDGAVHVEEVRLASGGPLRPIAGEDSGGTYFLCAGGEVLHADSEGSAALLAESLDDALEILIGLPGEASCLSSEDDDATLAAGLAEAEEELRENYGPGFDADRETLLSGLGLRLRPPRELLARMERAERRTEPDFVLLNAVEGCAYQLDDSLRVSARETVLAAARADLALLRTDATSHEVVAADPARRTGALAAVRHDHRPEDVPLLRTLLRHGLRAGDPADRLAGAAVLLARHGDATDHALLLPLRDSLPGFPDAARDLTAWAHTAPCPAPEDDPPAHLGPPRPPPGPHRARPRHPDTPAGRGRPARRRPGGGTGGRVRGVGGHLAGGAGAAAAAAGVGRDGRHGRLSGPGPGSGPGAERLSAPREAGGGTQAGTHPPSAAPRRAQHGAGVPGGGVATGPLRRSAAPVAAGKPVWKRGIR